MSFMLGSFAGGMFGGAQSVMNIYGMYQQGQERQLALDAANDVKAARADDAARGPQDVTQGVSGGVPGSAAPDAGTGTSTGTGTTTTAVPAGGTAGDPGTAPHPDSSRPSPARTGAMQAGARILHGQGRGDIDRSSMVPDAPPPAVTATGALGSTAPAAPAPASVVPPDPPAVNPAQGAAGMINPANPNGARQAIGLDAKPLLAPSAPSAPQAVPQPASAYAGMTSAQLADVSVHPGSYPNITPAQARAELDARSDVPTPTPTPTPTPAPSAIPATPATPAPQAGAPASAANGSAVSATSPTMADATPSLGSRILGALNPISSAQAAEPKPPTPAASTPDTPPVVSRTPPAAPPTVAPKETILAGPGAPPIPKTGAIPAQTASPFRPTSAASSGGTAQDAVPQPTQGRTLPSGVADAQVTLPEGRATAVAPVQQGPSVQSEQMPQAVRPPFDPRPYASVAQKSPQVKDVIDRIAARENVDPARLAWHWNQESGLHMTAPDGTSGERGVMQMLPSTQRQLGLSHLDPSNLEDSLTMGARYIHTLDTKFGQNTPLSFAAYQGGEGSATAIANGEGDRHPQTVAYMRAAFPGQVIRPQDLHGPIDVDARGAVQAGLQGGPDGFLHYIASQGPAGVPMSDKWRAAETSLMALAASKGDIDGMRHAQDFVLQMSQQGSTTSLMNAYKALNAGDGTTAAQQLARAHAFFPDGSMGRFGVDGRGQVWSQPMDEQDPSKALGKPTQVTPQVLQTMMIQTRDPKTFLAMVQEQQKQNAELRFKGRYGDYYSEMAKMRQDDVQFKHEDRQARDRETQYQHDLAAKTAEDAQAVKLATARNAGGGVDPALGKSVDSEVTKLYGLGGTATTLDGLNADQAGVAGQVHTDLRMNQSQSGQPISQPDAYRISSGLVKGTMTIVPSKNAPGMYGVFPRGQTGGQPEAVITGATASRLIHHLQPNGSAGGAAPQPGAQAIPTRGASANPLPMAQRSALPVATPAPNAPSTTTVQ